MKCGYDFKILEKVGYYKVGNIVYVFDMVMGNVVN